MTPSRLPVFAYGAALVVAMVGGFAAHEAAHWAAGRAMGLDMVMSLNSAGPAPGQAITPEQYFWVSAAGPAFTIAQALIAFALVTGRGSVLAYPFVFTAFLMRATATAVSLGRPNDEMRMSTWLGLGDWTLPLAVTGALFVLTVIAGRRLRIGWKTNFATWFGATALTTVVVFGDQMLK